MSHNCGQHRMNTELSEDREARDEGGVCRVCRASDQQGHCARCHDSHLTMAGKA